MKSQVPKRTRQIQRHYLDKKQAEARSGSLNKVGKGIEATKAVLSVLNNF